MSIPVLAVFAFVALMTYSTVAVAVARVFMPWRKSNCETCTAGKPHMSSTYNGLKLPRFHEDRAIWAGIFWVFLIPSLAFARTVVLLAKGPEAAGTLLSKPITRRADRRATLTKQVSERDTTIARLERELGMAEVQS